MWNLSKDSKCMRSLLSPLGVRTKKEWYENRIAKVHLVNGKEIYLTKLDTSYMSFRLYWDGWRYYEPIVMLALKTLLKGKKTFLDIGANIGYFSMFAASEDSEMQIISFEPDPTNFSILSENVRLNGIEKIRCEKLALSNKAGTMIFYVGKSNMQGTLAKRVGETYIDEIPVNVVPLDEYLTRYELTGGLLIKMSGGPHVPNIIHGAVKTLKTHRPDMFIEVVVAFNPETVKILKDLGYVFYRLTDKGFYKTETLNIHLDNDYLELFHLVTTRDSREVNNIFEGMKDKIKNIDRKKSSYPLPECQRPNVLKWTASE